MIIFIGISLKKCRDQIIRNYKRGLYCVEFNMSHLNTYDPELLDAIEHFPSKYLDQLEAASSEFLTDELSIRDPVVIQVLFKSTQVFTSIRHLSVIILP